MLRSSQRGWLAIDPKGLVEPREFDYCKIFTDPTPQAAVNHFDARVRAVSDEAVVQVQIKGDQYAAQQKSLNL